MREKNINRLTTFEITNNHPNYLHYKSYHFDLVTCIKKYAIGKLLDIGCGNKPYQKIIDPLVYEYIGCDIIQSSEQKVNILCEATDIPLPDESFDTVISTQTIEHVAEHQLMLSEAYRLLKRNGYLIISGPMYWPLHEEPYDFFRFTNHGFRHILTKAGFTIVEERANGGQWALFGQVLIQTLYQDLNTNISFKLRVLRRIIRIFGGIKYINNTFARMDDKYPYKSNTMNYVFVARKTNINDLMIN